MHTRSNMEIVIETLDGEPRRTKVWNPRQGGVFVIVGVEGKQLARLTVRRTKRVRQVLPRTARLPRRDKA